jgi:hypothetical protein
MGVRGWRKIDRDRDAWTLILKEPKVLHEPYAQWRDSKIYIYIHTSF